MLLIGRALLPAPRLLLVDEISEGLQPAMITRLKDVLTQEGIAAKERLMQELAERMPWCYALDDTERECFLGLLKKMLNSHGPSADSGPETASDSRDATVRSE